MIHTPAKNIALAMDFLAVKHREHAIDRAILDFHVNRYNKYCIYRKVYPCVGRLS